jgi:hypothetical protein
MIIDVQQDFALKESPLKYMVLEQRIIGLMVFQLLDVIHCLRRVDSGCRILTIIIF